MSINPALLVRQRAMTVSVNGNCDASSFYDSFECVPRDLLVLLAQQGSLHNVDESVQQCEDASILFSFIQALIDSQILELLKPLGAEDYISLACLRIVCVVLNDVFN